MRKPKLPATGSKSFRSRCPLATAALGLGLVLSGGVLHAAQPTAWVKGRVIVETRAGLSDAEMTKIAKGQGGKARRLGASNLFLIDLPGNASEVAVAARLAHNPHLKFAELDGLVKPDLVSNDPYLGSQWHLSKIGAPAAWDVTQGAAVTVAVLDTGVDVAHADLSAQHVAGWNFFANTANTSDVYNHGSKVAGAIAASFNNGLGVAGVAGKARFMPIKISDDSGYGSWSAMAQGLTHAADAGVRVANISYMVGGVASVQSAAQYMKNKNGLVFVSAGNTGGLVNDAVTTALIPVASTTTSDARSSFSAYGANIALAAPGQGIYTTAKGGSYGSVSGTSFSSPVAAGVAALVMAANPALSSAQVEHILFTTAVDLGAAGRDPYFGHGRVDAAAAVQAALNTPAADTQAPNVSIANPVANSTVSGLVAVDVNASDNVGVAKVELKVNGAIVATDLTGPFGFSWDSSQVPNGMASLSLVAYDAAGNTKASLPVSVNVANAVAADTTPPVVVLTQPVNGAKVSGNVAIKVTASDNGGAAGIRQFLYIDGSLVASSTGASLSHNWNARKAAVGEHQIKVTASDAAGNSTTVAVTVRK